MSIYSIIFLNVDRRGWLLISFLLKQTDYVCYKNRYLIDRLVTRSKRSRDAKQKIYCNRKLYLWATSAVLAPDANRTHDHSKYAWYDLFQYYSIQTISFYFQIFHSILKWTSIRKRTYTLHLHYVTFFHSDPPNQKLYLNHYRLIYLLTSILLNLHVWFLVTYAIDWPDNITYKFTVV